ncbi:hypothetical protein CRENBAI_005714 [Crenichthys baileyi]|uniref:Uncharacterized protein n=1 Tax=Crenichthys baileyi TaxID=28760 RepID=A0AAV9R7L8_9TELE
MFCAIVPLPTPLVLGQLLIKTHVRGVSGCTLHSFVANLYVALNTNVTDTQTLRRTWCHTVEEHVMEVVSCSAPSAHTSQTLRMGVGIVPAYIDMAWMRDMGVGPCAPHQNHWVYSLSLPPSCAYTYQSVVHPRPGTTQRSPNLPGWSTHRAVTPSGKSNPGEPKPNKQGKPTTGSQDILPTTQDPTQATAGIPNLQTHTVHPNP